MLLSLPGRIRLWALLVGIATIQVLASAAISKSQTVVPDASLTTVVTEDPGLASFRVTGGSHQGVNLFHSFEIFSPQDGSVSFDLTSDAFGSNIERIFSRVTGSQASEINGFLTVLGGNSPDLFLLNPNGILFGPNARLNLPGSFIATTAESFAFGDGNRFSALLPQSSPLLSISAPVGLQFGQNPGGITVLGNGHNLLRSTAFAPPLQDPAFDVQGLAVSPGNTLALLGGAIRFDGGEIQPVYTPTPEGPSLPLGGLKIEIGAFSQGQVVLQADPLGWGLGDGASASYEDILLTHQSWLNATGLLPGQINLTGHNITLNEGSSIALGNLGDQLATGDIDIQASGQFRLQGNGRLISDIQNTAFARGDGGDVNLYSDSLLLSDGAVVTSSTLDEGDAGSVTIRVTDELRLDGFTDVANPTPIFTAISASTFGSGDAGAVDVTARSIVLDRGGLILSSSFGSGEAGELYVTGTDSIVLRGINPLTQATTSITTAAFQSGNAADRTLVQTQRLEILEGATIGTDSFGSGNSGTLVVEASESIRVGGFDNSEVQTPAEISSAVVLDDLGASPFSAGEAIGDAGDVIIRTPSLELFDGGRVTVLNQGSGNAGTLEIQAERIHLTDQAQIVATTRQGEGGSIALSASDWIMLRDNSLISATAQGESGSGGNIAIQAPLLLAVPTENSDITANAENPVGQGGAISITSAAVLGLTVQERQTAQSDITASSDRGPQFSGTVALNKTGDSLASEFTTLPSNFSRQDAIPLANACSGDLGNFMRTGRGGLPMSPNTLLHDRLHPPEPLDPINRAISLRSQGFYPKALSLLLTEVEALSSLPEAEVSEPSLARQVIAWRQLGITHKLLAQHAESQMALEQSLVLASKLEPLSLRESHISATYLSLGNLARAHGDGQEARSHYQNALEHGRSNHRRQQQVMANQLALEFTEANDAAVQLLMSQLLEKFLIHNPEDQDLGSRTNVVATLLKYQKLELLPNALAFLEQNLSLAEALEDEAAIAYALAYLGQAHEQQQQWEQAQQFSEAALEMAQFQSDAFQEYQFAWQLGRITKARWEAAGQGNRAWMSQSEAAYELALNALEQLRVDLATVSPVLQFSFRQQVEPVYREYVNLVLSAANSTPSRSSFGQAQQHLFNQAIHRIEDLRLAELEDFLNDGCLETRPQAADQLDRKAAVVYPIVLEDRLEVIVSHQGRLRRHQVPVSAEVLERTVQAFERGLVTRSRRSYKQPGQQLYDWLIAPLLPELEAEGIETLVFVPDGPLQSSPLGALWNGEQFLIEQFAVVTAPSLQLLPSQGEVSRDSQAFVAGISQAKAGFAPLVNVEQELQAVQERFPGTSLVNESFTLDAFGQALLDIQTPIVHIATHGQFSSNASETFLLAWDSVIDMEQFQQLLERREQGTATPIELLVLSACETATGDEAATLGLAGMAIRAGARSTLASLWSVEDKSTAFLMEQFYQQLAQPESSKAESLREAQIAMLQDPIYRHPYYWSAFTLMGNWQ